MHTPAETPHRILRACYILHDNRQASAAGVCYDGFEIVREICVDGHYLKMNTPIKKKVARVAL
jgi:hypothetical protein